MVDLVLKANINGRYYYLIRKFARVMYFKPQKQYVGCRLYPFV